MLNQMLYYATRQFAVVYIVYPTRTVVSVE